MGGWFAELWLGSPVYVGLIYLGLAVVCLIQLFRIFINRYLLVSYQGGFLVLTFLWCVIRLVFLLSFSFPSWPDTIVISLYWVPLCLQFATFSLYLLFYLETVHLRHWDRIGICFEFAYLAVNLVYICFTSANITADGLLPGHTASDVFQIVRFCTSGFLFVIVAVLFLGYGEAVARLDTVHARQMRFGKRHKWKVRFTTLVLFAVFASRCVFDLLNAAGAFSVEMTPRKLGGFELFFFLFVWELSPALLIIFVFRRIPAHSDKRLRWFGRFLSPRRRTRLRGLSDEIPSSIPSPIPGTVVGYGTDEYGYGTDDYGYGLDGYGSDAAREYGVEEEGRSLLLDVPGRSKKSKTMLEQFLSLFSRRLDAYENPASPYGEEVASS